MLNDKNNTNYLNFFYLFDRIESWISMAKLHWADFTAEKIIRERGDLEEYTCASGITPSGTVHIGNFREIISVELVVRALQDLGKKVRFIYSWDDYDVFRKVPLNMPKQDVLQKYLRYPITAVPDTFERDESYARHHEVDVESTLPLVGIYPEYLYQAKNYQKGQYADGMKKALQQREHIKNILNSFRDPSHQMEEEYWPVSVFCSSCSKDTTTIDKYDGDWKLKYHCECGNDETIDLRTTSIAKLGWRVDWPMRWEYENVVFEPAGKDHHSKGGSFDTAEVVAKEIYNYPAPVSFSYDFIGLKGLPGKMSSSKGQVVSLGYVLKYYQPEVIRYLFTKTRPNSEFSISFDLDVIKIYEDYDKTERIAYGLQKAKNDDILSQEKRIYELSQVEKIEKGTTLDPAKMPYQLPFRHLCNLLQTNSGDIDATLDSLDDLKDFQRVRLYKRAECAWNWITECAPDDFKFQLRKDEVVELTKTEENAIQKIVLEILPNLDSIDEKEISNKLYDIARECDLEPTDLFVATYKKLICQEKGPRLANFMKILGRDRLELLLK